MDAMSLLPPCFVLLVKDLPCCAVCCSYLPVHIWLGWWHDYPAFLDATVFVLSSPSPVYCQHTGVFSSCTALVHTSVLSCQLLMRAAPRMAAPRTPWHRLGSSENLLGFTHGFARHSEPLLFILWIILQQHCNSSLGEWRKAHSLPSQYVAPAWPGCAADFVGWSAIFHLGLRHPDFV
jgi:hypothetical protein